MLLIKTFLGILLFSLTILAEAAAPKCSKILEKIDSGDVGLKTGVEIILSQQEYSANVQKEYLFSGLIDGQGLGSRSNGTLLTVLDGQFLSGKSLDKSVKNLPEIARQTQPDNCAETALRHIFKLKGVNPGSKYFGLAPSQIDPFNLRSFGGPFVGYVVTMQTWGQKLMPAMQGLNVKDINTHDAVREAIQEGKTLFIGAQSNMTTVYKMNEKGELLGSYEALEPSLGGYTGHAMVIAGSFKDKNGNLHAMLADPYSGLTRPVLVDENFLEAIHTAFTVD